MPGFSSITGLEAIMYADNASFDGTKRAGAMASNGQLWIGSVVAPHVRLGTLTAGSGVSIANGVGTITISASGSVPIIFAADVGTASPAANTITLAGAHGINTSATGSTVTTAINNAITLGDLSAIGAGSNALTATTGDIAITAGNLKLANTNTGATAGIILFGGNRFISNFGTGNTFAGQTSGNTTVSGSFNTGIGSNALLSITSGSANTCVGYGCGTNLIDTIQNSALGYNALTSTADRCVAIGFQALTACTLPGQNVAIGVAAAQALTSGTETVAVGYQSLTSCTGSFNTAVGFDSAPSITSGTNNTCVGGKALFSLLTGTQNICMGYSAGIIYTGSETGNILIGNQGVLGESLVIRIGGITGLEPAKQTTCFIAGITGNTVSNQQFVTINSATGQLGVSASGGGGITWTEVTGTTQAMAINTGYILNNAGLVTATLPSTAAQGSIISVAGKGAGGWLIAQNAGQTIHFGSVNTTTGAGGSLASTNRYDSIQLLVITANTDWLVLSAQGNITVV